MSTEDTLRQRKKKKVVSSDDEDNLKSTGTPGQPPQNVLKKVLTRTLMGTMMVGVFTLILNIDHVVIALFIIGLQILVFREILNVRYNVVKERELYGFRSLNWFFLWNTLFYFYGRSFLSFLPGSWLVQNLIKYHLGISFILYVIGFVTFILMMRKGYYKYQITQMTWTLMTLLIIVVQSNFIMKNLFEGIIWFLLPCAIIVVNDIFAYFSGLIFGKKFIHRPFLKISPNKTWEGFIGATFWTLLFGFFFAGFFAKYEWLVCPRAEINAFNPLHCAPDYVFLQKNYYLPVEISDFFLSKLNWDVSYVTLRPIQFHSLVFSLFGSLIAPFGGFFASAIKRAYRIKDFDSIFPGHGGFTDRTDCQYIMGLFIYVYYSLFIHSSAISVNTIFDNILQLSLADQQILLSKLNDTVVRSLAPVF